MYDQRIKVFFVVAGALLLVCLGRLVQMQLQPREVLAKRIATLKGYRSSSEQLNTVRGRILDRNGCELARDVVHWKLLVSYWELTKYQDPNLQTVLRNRARAKEDPRALERVEKRLAKYQRLINELINRCAIFGLSRAETLTQIQDINTKIWDQRLHFAWRHNCQDSPLGLQYQGKMGAAPLPAVKKDFIKQFPDRARRLEKIGRVDIQEMKWDYPLLELSRQDVAYGQREFCDIPGVSINPVAERVYPYKTSAAQLIGWTGVASLKHLTKLFENDPLARYLDGEICGRMGGVEYACEAVLRGRRGQIVTDIDGEVARKINTHLGQDVKLTLDIKLQKDIENFLINYPLKKNYWDPNMAVVVIDVDSADILAMVSLPTYDLNQARYEIGKTLDPNALFNRCLDVHYKPGSVAKPITVIAGLEGHYITPDEVIHCPSHKAPTGWPSCWYWRDFGMGHDEKWLNTARNAIKGSCNIYVSRLAYERIPPRELQQWLFKFGYGQQVPFQYPTPADPNHFRRLRQAPGQISSTPNYGKRVTSFDQIGDLHRVHTRRMAMGEENFNATILQAANSMATLARRGTRINPRLFILSQQQAPNQAVSGVLDLNISDPTLATIYDGLYAVVNESGGSAYNAFSQMDFARQDVKIWGKTGSTQDPENALFGGFARDSRKRQIALALVIEGGHSGGKEAAPVARDIIQICIDHGYIGNAN